MMNIINAPSRHALNNMAAHRWVAGLRGEEPTPPITYGVQLAGTDEDGVPQYRLVDMGSFGGQTAAPPPRAEVPAGTQISAPAQQADAQLQADYAKYAQQLAALQGGQGGQGQQPAGPSIWDFINQGVANAPNAPAPVSPYGQAPSTPYGQAASFNPYGTNVPGANALFGPTGTSQIGQP